jgi:beta-lactamase superfamily II metal-dependent hydrolase
MKRRLVIIILIIVLCLVGGYYYFYFTQPKSVEVTIFDVGQGDAIGIRTPAGQNIIIDGGSNNKLIQKVGTWLPLYDRTIDVILITHPHDDHLVGLIELLKRYNVKLILSSLDNNSNKNFQEIKKIAREKNIPWNLVKLGNKIDLGSEVAWEMDGPITAEFDETPNNESVVSVLRYGNECVVFAGDAEAKEEKEIIDAKITNLDCDVLKAGHHGSDTSSSDEWLKVVTPKYALISVGKNNVYKHPSLRTVARLERAGARVLRTDEMGNIKLEMKKDAVVLE